MEFNKEEILNSINCEVRNSFKRLLESTIYILQNSIKENGRIPTREVLKVIPYSGGYKETKNLEPDLYYLIGSKIWELEEFKECSEIFHKNELLGSQGVSSFLILPSFIADYLDNIDPESITFDQELFDSLFDDYRNALLSFTYETAHMCPLLGFESEVDILRLDENLTIRKITTEELNKIWNMVSFFSSSLDFKAGLANVKYVIEQRVTRIDKFTQKSNADLIPVAVFALRLFKNGKFWASGQLNKSSLPWKIKMNHVSQNSQSQNSFLPQYRYSLSKDDVDDLKKYYLLSKHVQNLRSRSKYKQLFRAIEWFNRYHNESNIEHQFIFLMLLMEALCSDAVETQYRLSNRISLVIGEDEDRIEIINKFKELYGGPRKIVHGEDAIVEEKHVLFAEDYSRRLLQKFILISLNGYGIQDARTLIDNALVSETKRKELFGALNFDKTYEKFNEEAKKPKPLYAFLKDELYEIKNDLDRFTDYYRNKGFIYKSIIINGLEDTFTESLWNEITKFYDAYFAYLILLRESSDLVRNIIQEVIHKIKTEEDASKWMRKHLEKVNNGPGYNLNNFLRKDTIKNIPEINDDQYLFLDSPSDQWDLKITLEDLSRSGRSIEDMLKEIHGLVARENLISELRKSRSENLKMISSLIKEIEENLKILN